MPNSANSEAQRRKLVFANLVNGVPVQSVMTAFRMSELEVMADFQFVAQKIRSYRFQRMQPLRPLDTIQEAQAWRIELLDTLGKLNLDKPADIPKIVTVPFDVEPGRVSQGEHVMRELMMRRSVPHG